MNNFIGTMLISRQFPKGNGLNYALQVPCLILISMATAFPVQCHSLQQSKMWGGMCHVALYGLITLTITYAGDSVINCVH